MTEERRKKALEHLRRLQKLTAHNPRIDSREAEEEIMKSIRRTRMKLWKEKIALRS